MADAWSDAIAEAYASAPLEDVILSTLELSHPALAEPIRVVADLGEIIGEADEQPVFGHMLTLETGEVAKFIACGFGFALPAQEEGQIPSVQISVDNIAYLITPQLDGLLGSRAKLEVVYREYLASDPSAPQFILPGLSMANVTSDLNQLTGTATFADLVNRNFPNKVYRPSEYPGLVA
jgi:hypothetical protein